MALQELLNRKLLVVSGKGGVGKTSVAAALGLIASRQGKKTLIAEVNSSERIASLFGLKKIGYEETQIAERLFAINVDPKSAFEEYVLEQIHSKKIYHLIFENRFVRSFLDATPGLNALLEIGKIWALTERDKDEIGNPKYDLVILDAPATGHGLAMLNVPRVVASAIRIGPLKTKAQQILNLIQDAQKTRLLIVSLAEEMPINEALEMLHSARDSVGVTPGPLILNQIFPSPFSEEEWKHVLQGIRTKGINQESQNIEKILHFFHKKMQLQKFYRNKLKLEAGDHPVVELPYLFREPFDRSAIEELSGPLEQSCNQVSIGPLRARRKR